MAFRFIHTADWQIGRQFGAFDDETSARLRGARISVIERIAEIARDRGARHILVAGDIFDRENSEPATYQQPIAKLKAYKDLIWHLLPGNHDAVRGTVWNRFTRDGLPTNLRLYSEPGIHEIEPGVDLLVAPVMTRTATEDLTAWMDETAATGDNIRIGFAHGSVKNIGSDASILIDENRAQKAKLDYLALGDWHGLTEINPRTWYSGTPEPDSWKDNDPGHVLSVQISARGAAPEVEAVPSRQYVWHTRALDVTDGIDTRALEEELTSHVPQPDHLLVRLKLNGLISPADYAQLDVDLTRMAANFCTLIRDERELETQTVASDLEVLNADPVLRLAAERLQALAENTDADSNAHNAANALRKLFQYHARAGRGGST